MTDREFYHGDDERLQRYFRARSGLADDTLDNHARAIRHFTAFCEERGIDFFEADVLDVIDFLEQRAEQYPGITVKGDRDNLKAVYEAFLPENKGGDKSALVPDLLDTNPADVDLKKNVDVGSTKPVKQQYADENGKIYLSPEEVRQLRENVPKPKVRNELLIKVLSQTGARVGELRRIKIDDVKREERKVVLDDTKTDSTRQPKYDSLDPELTMWLDGGFRDRFCTADESDYLFLTKQSGQISSDTVQRVVKEAAENAGIQESIDPDGQLNRARITPHVLRSTYIVNLFKAGLTVPEVMEYSGHEKVQTIRDYAKIVQDDVDDRFEELSPTFEA